MSKMVMVAVAVSMMISLGNVTGSTQEKELMTDIVALEGLYIYGYEGYLSVASVIMNRVESDRFPDTITKVISQPVQFSTFGSSREPYITVDTVRAVNAALSGARNVPSDVLFFCTREAYEKSRFFQSLEVHSEAHGHMFFIYRKGD